MASAQSSTLSILAGSLPTKMTFAAGDDTKKERPAKDRGQSSSDRSSGDRSKDRNASADRPTRGRPDQRQTGGDRSGQERVDRGRPDQRQTGGSSRGNDNRGGDNRGNDIRGTDRPERVRPDQRQNGGRDNRGSGDSRGGDNRGGGRDHDQNYQPEREHPRGGGWGSSGHVFGRPAGYRSDCYRGGGWYVGLSWVFADPYVRGTRDCDDRYEFDISYCGRTLDYGYDERPYRLNGVVMVAFDRTARQLRDVDRERDRDKCLVYLNYGRDEIIHREGTNFYRLNGRSYDLDERSEDRRGTFYVPIDMFRALVGRELQVRLG